VREPSSTDTDQTGKHGQFITIEIKESATGRIAKVSIVEI